MTSPAGGATVRVEWDIQPAGLTGLTLPIARLKVELYLATASPGPATVLRKAWLDTGAPLSVIPFHTKQQGRHWHPIPGIRVPGAGHPCQLGRVDCCLPTVQPPALHGPLSLLAKFPQSDPPGD